MPKRVPDFLLRSRYREIGLNGRRIRLHRYIAEQMLGRPLRDGEVVHHINGNTLDNRPENLQVMTKSEHSRLESLGNKNRVGHHYTEEEKHLISEQMKEIRRRRFWSSRKK